jgi:prepilin-type N-terminal cleavage/methylation domain-containing protein
LERQVVNQFLRFIVIAAKGKIKAEGIMKKPILSWIKQLSNQNKRKAGFTLIELLAVVFLIGIIATIAGPSWLTFTNQRRVTAANDVVLKALQEAQSKAKKEKLSYSVSFKNESGKVPELAIHPTKKANGTDDVDPTNASDMKPELWRSLGKDLSLKPGQVILRTNITAGNQGGSSPVKYDPQTLAKITFDYMGTLDKTSGNPSLPLIIEVAAPVGNSTDPIPSTKRCVKITTLLGTIQPGRVNECNPPSSPI